MANAKLGQLIGKPKTIRQKSDVRREADSGYRRTFVLSGGLQSVTMERIADTIGVAKPVIYRHFKHSGDVSLAVMETYWAEIAPYLDALFSGNFDEDLLKAATVYFVDQAAKRQKIRALLDMLNGYLRPLPQLGAPEEEARGCFVSRNCRTNGKRPSSARTIATMCIGALTWLGGTGASDREPPETKALRYSEFVAAGINAYVKIIS